MQEDLPFKDALEAEIEKGAVERVGCGGSGLWRGWVVEELGYGGSGLWRGRFVEGMGCGEGRLRRGWFARL